MQILIAEDDVTARAVVAHVLAKNGYEVIATTNGSDAWQLLQQADAPPLVILDWMMPGLDGPEVLRRVRAVHTDRPPHVIMLSAQDDTADIISGLEIGANDYLVKPFDPGELLARVHVGARKIEMQLKLHHYRAQLQCLRVANDQSLARMQDALAAKCEELRRTKHEMRVLASQLLAMRAF